MFFDKFPYTNLHNVNLDWVLQKVKEWGAMVEDNNQRFENLQTAYEAFRDWLTNDYNNFKDYVTSYLENLDVQQEINNKLDDMLRSGELTPYLQPYIVTEVANWLDENITPTTPPVDATLSIAGAAADAKATGDAIRNSIDASINNTVDAILIKRHTLTFEQGAINPNTGVPVLSENAIRTVDFFKGGKEDFLNLDTTEGIVRIIADSPFNFYVFVYDSSDHYIGILKRNGEINRTLDGAYNSMGIIWNDEYKYKVALYNPGNAITVADAENCYDCVFTDQKLKTIFHAADAGSVGARMNSIFTSTDFSIDFVNESINGYTGIPIATQNAISTPSFIDGDSGILYFKTEGNYFFRIMVFDASNQFLGAMRNDGSIVANRPFSSMQEFTVPYNPEYKYKIVMFKLPTETILTEEGTNLTFGTLTSIEHINTILDSSGIGTSSNALYSSFPEFVGEFEEIFNEENAVTGIDDARYNYMNVVKISDSMYYMYYEAFARSDGAPNYPGSRTCFAYSTDGLNFIKGFPAGITNPGYAGNMILPKGTVTGQFVFKVPDTEYPFRMIGTQGTDPNRITKMWKSSDGVNWTFVKQITEGYNDGPAAAIVRDGYIKMFLRTRDSNGRAIGVIVTDLDGNRVYPGWSEVISTNDITNQMYGSAATMIDDRRVLLLPTLYDPANGTDPERLCAMIINGASCSIRPMNPDILWNEGEKSFYIGGGIIQIGMKYYMYYNVHFYGHDDASTVGMTGSAIRRIEITNPTFPDVVRP